MEVSLSPEQAEKIRATVEDTVARFIENLPEMINRRLETIVAQCLGFENRWRGEWRVDNCNSRQSTVGNYIAVEAHKIVGETAERVGSEWEITDEQVEGLREDLRKRVVEKVRSHMWKASEEKAQEVIGKLLESVNISLGELEVKDPTLEEMADPSYGKNLLEQVLMAKAAKPHLK